MTQTAAKGQLHTLATADLIAQYELAISSSAGRYSNTAPRQKRIDHIVDLLGERSEDGDADARNWVNQAMQEV